MIYYRVALLGDQSNTWRWKSTVLTSLDALLGFLRLYSMIPKDHIRVFFSSTVESMDEMLARENKGLASNSITAEQFLKVRYYINSLEMARLEAEVGALEVREAVSAPAYTEWPLNERIVSPLDVRRLELELGAVGDHDAPYTFTLPTAMPQFLAWMNLLIKVQAGELEP